MDLMRFKTDSNRDFIGIESGLTRALGIGLSTDFNGTSKKIERLETVTMFWKKILFGIFWGTKNQPVAGGPNVSSELLCDPVSSPVPKPLRSFDPRDSQCWGWLWKCGNQWHIH